MSTVLSVDGHMDVLVVDDERPTVEMLVHYLRLDKSVGQVHTAHSAQEALLVLYDKQVDAVLLDIHMPGLSGLDVARAIGRFATPPAIVFVTADEEQALKAFDLDAADYILKPVSPLRLRRSLERVRRASRPAADAPQDRIIAMDLGGVSAVVRRDEIQYVEAAGDYVRLHTANFSSLVRASISSIEEEWADDGFVRIHRSYLVALAHVDQIRLSTTSGSVLVGSTELPVSRRNLSLVRRRLHATRPGTRHR